MPAAARKQAMLDAASGTAGIVIGTHALLSENVAFYDLGLIVVDEQHRFGVEQRDVLRSKASKPPHLLVMTATPDSPDRGHDGVRRPRNLRAGRAARRPRARSPPMWWASPKTPRWAGRIWSRSREEIDAGHQVYVVCPKIGTDDDGDFSPGEAEPSAGGPGRARTARANSPP